MEIQVRDLVSNIIMRLRRGNVLLFSLSLITIWLFIVMFTPAPPSTEKSSYHRDLMAGLKAKHASAVTKATFDESKHKVKMKETNLSQTSLPVPVNNIDKEMGNLKILKDSSWMKNIQNEIQNKSETSLNKSEVVLFQWERNLIVSRKPKTKAAYSKLWDIAGSWVNEKQIHPIGVPELGSVLHALSTAKINKADIGYKGTQLKARLVLEGGQMVVFKPKWYSRTEVMTGTPYSGKDRHNGEIAGFHLNRILGFNRAPLVAGRRVNLMTEALPVATPKLNETVMFQNNNTCFYGKCYYCKPSDPACAEGNIMEGSLTLWLPASFMLQRWKHPWARTYRSNVKARWEEDNSYCEEVKKNYPIDRKRLLLDMIDTAFFDYLIGNADRHTFETFAADEDPMLLLIDNGKSFGNPYWDETSILAPVKQCCRVRRSTWDVLQQFKDGKLSETMRAVLSHDPIAPVLSDLHLDALDRRLTDIFDVVNTCVSEHGEAVFV